MTPPDFRLVSSSAEQLEAECYFCRRTFDLMRAASCECVTRDRTFLCPSCGGCACEATPAVSKEFWLQAPPALWRRRRDRSSLVTNPARIDGDTTPRPLALIADDDPIVLAVADRALRAMGFATVMTSNPMEAQSLANSMMPVLLLTDALMPTMDGRELCRQLKSEPRTQSIKVIVMSAMYRGTSYRNEAFREFLVDEYLPKPLKPGVLREAVERLLPELVRNEAAPSLLRAVS